jgi:DNA uptake protein ComE-like DNA-binding protein
LECTGSIIHGISCFSHSQWLSSYEITLNHGSDYRSLREFCQKYAWKVAAIHEKYFSSFDASYNLFENKARQLVEAEARKHWSQYLDNKAYTISTSSTTKILNNHAFDCYVELLHNGSCVARAFGEAKNYQLLSSHLKTFELWLQDVNFNPESNPPELAFLIAPDCASLLKRKIDLKNIGFLKCEKVESEEIKKTIDHEMTLIVDANNSGTDINTAPKEDIINAVRGSGIKATTIDSIVNKRKFNDLDDLAIKLRFTDKVKKKLQDKLNAGKIRFSN